MEKLLDHYLIIHQQGEILNVSSCEILDRYVFTTALTDYGSLYAEPCAGGYKVIRAGLRLLEDDESQVMALKSAINEGLESGIEINFNPEAHLQGLKKRHGSK